MKIASQYFKIQGFQLQLKQNRKSFLVLMSLDLYLLPIGDIMKDTAQGFKNS